MTKEEIYEQLVDARDTLCQLADKMNAITRMVEQLPDTAPQPEPGPTIERNYVLLGTPAEDGQPEITVDIPENPGTPYFALTSMEQNGPDNNIAILVTDADGTPVTEDVLVGVEGTDISWALVSGEKGPGLCEIPYDRKLFWVRIGSGHSDIVRHASTNRNMPEDQPKDMVNGHIRLELIFRKVR